MVRFDDTHNIAEGIVRENLDATQQESQLKSEVDVQVRKTDGSDGLIDLNVVPTQVLPFTDLYTATLASQSSNIAAAARRSQSGAALSFFFSDFILLLLIF